MTDVGLDDTLAVPQGDFVLRRHGQVGAEPLRAWDAADEYVLHELDGLDLGPGGRWLVVDDGSGALVVALAAACGGRIVGWTDSRVTELATVENLRRNGLDPDAVELVPSTEPPRGPFDRVIVKVPRTKAHLDDLLRRLRPQLADEAVVIGAGMTKSVHRSTIEAFETHLGPTSTSLARKKARLLRPVIARDLVASDRPSPESVEWTGPDGLVVTGLPNVFSSNGLDAGTRLLVDHLPALPPGGVAVDLGCGTGVGAATIASRCPGVLVVCCDESHQAVAAARSTVGRVTDDATFRVIDVLDGVEDESADLIVVNPPFHAGGARTTSVARRMFTEARRVLRPGGTLLVVGNRHLGHHVHLKRIFGSVETVASNPKFVVLGARRRGR